MCLFCLTTLGIIVAGAASTGGLAAAILSGKKAGAREALPPRNAEDANQKVKRFNGAG